MSTHCPKCSKRYGLIERLAGPTMCAACNDQYGPSSPLASFEEDLEEDGKKDSGGFRSSLEVNRLQLIASRNIQLGVSLGIAGILITAGTLYLAVESSGGGFFIFSSSLVLGGLERGIRGYLQNRVVKRMQKYGLSLRQAQGN